MMNAIFLNELNRTNIITLLKLKNGHPTPLFFKALANCTFDPKSSILICHSESRIIFFLQSKAIHPEMSRVTIKSLIGSFFNLKEAFQMTSGSLWLDIATCTKNESLKSMLPSVKKFTPGQLTHSILTFPPVYRG